MIAHDDDDDDDSNQSADVMNAETKACMEDAKQT